ncbi:uncharacterized protein LOC112088890 [Eutrema salsugineum]|uniref:uncharacterized protein LOC112088890 n=1 Tax=Eutrema salsugineum TaxID=72664 RepID=UPI000CED1F64|nr:uncharacterized protein LOC112088890 [Eutrema salsugineum]
MEELTYSVLVDGICKKIGLNDMDKERLRAILNVELMEDIESEELPRAEDAPDIEGQQGQQRDQLIVFNPEEAEGQQGQPERMDNVDLRVSCEIEGQQGQPERMENVDLRVSCEISLPEENAECGMHEDVDEHDHVEPLRPVEQTRFVLEWEDGAGFEKGQEFRSKEALRVLVDRASHKGCFEVKTVKSDTGRLILRCRQAELGCTWYLHAVRIVDSTYFSIRVYRNIHTCSRVVSSTIRNKRKGTPQVVADVLRGCYPGEVDTPAPKALIKVVQNEAHVNVSYSTALRGKKLAISEVRGSPEESYRKLYCYLYMLQLVNPGTITSVKLDAKNKFKYLFVALGASIEGFRAMRKVIVVDATFLKSVYGGMLVFATAQDPNHHHYPIAMGVIDIEKDASWKWFFETLKTVIPDDKELVFMSDRHKSIIGAVKEVYPQSQHGYCIWHLSQNVRGKAGIGCKDLCAVKFRECAHKYTESEFLCAYTDFRIWFPKAAEYLDEHVAVDKWARCFFKGDKYNLDTSNACESMNSVFKKARKYALLPLIDAYVEKIFNKHRKDTAYASDSKTLVPYVENQLHSVCAIGTRLFVTELNATHLEYSVIGDDGKSYLVDLLSKCCSCRRFDIDKIPCVHAIAADIAMMRSAERRREIHLHELCSKYYHIDTWALAYYRTIYMFNSQVQPGQFNSQVQPDKLFNSQVQPDKLVQLSYV